MDDNGANIDLLFRNGLKDYEVLPPPEVWDRVKPVVVRQSHAPVILRVAAAAAALTAISLFALRSGRESFPGFDNGIAMLNIEKNLPLRMAFIASDQQQQDPIVVKTIMPALADKGYGENFSVEAPALAYIASDLKKLEFVSDPMPELVFSGIPGKDYNITDTGNELTTGIPIVYPELKQVRQKWSIAAMASPTYYSGIHDGNSISEDLMEKENAVISYSGGFAVSYKVNKRFSIQTGLYYASRGKEVTGINTYGGLSRYYFAKGDHNFEVTTSNGTVFTDNADVFLAADGKDRIISSVTSNVFDPDNAKLDYVGSSLVQSFSYIQMPVVMRYKMIDKTLDINLIGGVSYDLLVGNSVYAGSGPDKYRIGRTEGLNPFSLSSSVGLGMEYDFSKKISLNFEPTFRYYINPFNRVSGSGIHPYSFGIFSGFSYTF